MRWRVRVGLFIATLVFLLNMSGSAPIAWADVPAVDVPAVVELAQAETQERLPELRSHPLPPSLEQWSDRTQQGDYFDQLNNTPVGALVWSQFPVKVYVEPVVESVTPNRSQVWRAAVERAIAEWSVYLPLQVVGVPETADIQILRATPAVQRNGRTTRARAAETRYEFFVSRPASQTPGELPQPPALLKHRFTLVIRPGMADAQLLAAARHELGHALGIWGHSPQPTDALYFSQVRIPPPISVRDINTLKRVYEQPTRLGWLVQ